MIKGPIRLMRWLGRTTIKELDEALDVPKEDDPLGPNPLDAMTEFGLGCLETIAIGGGLLFIALILLALLFPALSAAR